MRRLIVVPERLAGGQTAYTDPERTGGEDAPGQLDVEEADPPRPLVRGDCLGGSRPCPWVSCRHHLLVDVRPSGSLQVNFDHEDVTRMEETCSLDVADRGGETTLDQIGALMGVTRERIRQIEFRILEKARRARGLRDLAHQEELPRSAFLDWVERRRHRRLAGDLAGGWV